MGDPTPSGLTAPLGRSDRPEGFECSGCFPLRVSSTWVAVLFLGSVARRLLRDLDSTCGGLLEVILGYRPSSSLERIFIGSHSLPPSLVAISVLQIVSEPVADRCNFNQLRSKDGQLWKEFRSSPLR